jgi:hypothetical protein
MELGAENTRRPNVEKFSGPTPEADVRWYSYKVAEITSESPIDEARSNLESLLSALSKIQDANFGPGLRGWRLIRPALTRLSLDLEVEMNKYLDEFPSLSIWQATSPPVVKQSNFSALNAEIRSQIKIAVLARDFLTVRALTLKLLQNISGNRSEERQNEVRRFAGTYLMLEDLLAQDVDQLRLCYQNFYRHMEETEHFRGDVDLARVRETFIRLAETFHSDEIDSYIQMAACLREFKRSDLALEILDWQMPELGKFVNPYFENSLLAVLLDLEIWDRAKLLVERLTDTGPVVVVNRARILPTIWRFHKEMFVLTGDYSSLHTAEKIVDEMPSSGVEASTVLLCRNVLSAISGDQHDGEVEFADVSPRSPRNRAPSVAREIEESGLVSELESWFTMLPK